MFCLLISRPGAGKSTVANKLHEHGFKKFMMSDKLMASVGDHESSIGYIRRCIKFGTLVRDDLAIPVIEDVFESLIDEKLILGDGPGRSYAQARFLEKKCAERGFELPVVFIDTPVDVCFSRLMNRKNADGSKREDDEKDIISNRMLEFSLKTSPAIEYFKAKSGKSVVRFTTIKGTLETKDQVNQTLEFLGLNEQVPAVRYLFNQGSLLPQQTAMV